MIWLLESAQVLRPRYYLNGFPKAGLHLLALMVTPISAPRPADALFAKNWAGTWQDNAWTMRVGDMQRAYYHISLLGQGQYLRAHAGYNADLDRLLTMVSLPHVFISRDFRDVAVSQAHHILSDREQTFMHPAKGLYRSMGSFDKVLLAVIEGVGPFAGVMDRWELYAPWLESDHVHHVTFEAALADKHKTAGDLIEYGLRCIYPLTQRNTRIDEERFSALVSAMVEAASATAASPTFRKGRVGDWREEFTQQHKDAFKASDSNGWLVRLGYEKDNDW